MRRFFYMLALCVVPSACRHDLTICHDENDGPACRDSAPAEAAGDETGDADSIDGLPDSSTVDTGSVEDSTTGADIDPPEVSVDSTVSDSTSEATDALSADTPDAFVADTSGPDTFVADTYAPDTFVTDTHAPDTSAPDTFVADSMVADTNAADTFVPDTSIADTAPACTTGSYVCGGSTGNDLLRCGDAGYSLVVSCPAGTCSASLGRCTACSPGAYSCSGATRKQCDSLGSTGVVVATCVTPELCAASTGGTCASPVCSPSYRVCVGPPGWLQTCNAGQTAFVDTECTVDCAGGQCLTVTSLEGSGPAFCALVSNGTLRCGLDYFNAIPDISTAVQVSVGANWIGARLSDGTVRVWIGAAGGAAAGPAVPGSGAPVAGITGVEYLAVGEAHACVRLAGGVVKCWGTNDFGQLGNGTTTDAIPPTLATASLTAVGVLAAGVQTSFAVTASGAASWGRNDTGLLGVGSTTNKLWPTAGFGSVVAFTVGDSHACGLSAAGTVTCAGANEAGQLGDGSTVDHSSPAPVLGLDGLVARVAAAERHTCALLKDGTVRCWGMNSSGQLGDGTTTNRSYPVVVSGLSGVKLLAAAQGRTCAVLSDSMTLKCWGNGKLVPTTTSWH